MNKKIISLLVILNILFSSAFIVTAEPDDPVSDEAVSQTESKDEDSQNTNAEETEEEKAPEKEIDPSLPAPHAEAVLLMDMKTGKVLYERNSLERLFPASTTKIMTAILTLENADLSEEVAAQSEAIMPITNQHSHMGIKTGEVLTVEQLLSGMLVYSANDAANVLAVHIAGSIEAFAGMMNEKAAALGAENTHFTNPHGFHDPDHYTCAADLARFARYAMQNEKFREIVKTDMYEIPPTEKYTSARYLSNTNHLVSRRRRADLFYDKATGIKTGHTDEAESCLVASAENGDTEFLSVVMKCKNLTSAEQMYSFYETKKLFEDAFLNYKYLVLAKKDDIVYDSPVYEAKKGVRVALSPAEEVSALLPVSVDLETDITMTPQFPESGICAPIKKGDTIGRAIYTYNNETVGEADLIASNDVDRDIILTAVHTALDLIRNPIFLAAAFILLVLIIKNHNRKKRRKQKAMRRARQNTTER